jgi:glutamyl/glutaminyl-tRNA synthetase
LPATKAVSLSSGWRTPTRNALSQNSPTNITSGLQWLGLDWDEGPFFQSERLDLYRQAIQTLLDKGLAYRAYDTPEELDAMREAMKAKGQAPRYDNRHRHLTPEQQAAFEAEGRPAVIRFKIDDSRTISWNDMVRGPYLAGQRSGGRHGGGSGLLLDHHRPAPLQPGGGGR